MTHKCKHKKVVHQTCKGNGCDCCCDGSILIKVYEEADRLDEEDEDKEIEGEEIGPGHYRHGHLPTADKQ